MSVVLRRLRRDCRAILFGLPVQRRLKIQICLYEPAYHGPYFPMEQPENNFAHRPAASVALGLGVADMCSPNKQSITSSQARKSPRHGELPTYKRYVTVRLRRNRPICRATSNMPKCLYLSTWRLFSFALKDTTRPSICGPAICTCPIFASTAFASKHGVFADA